MADDVAVFYVMLKKIFIIFICDVIFHLSTVYTLTIAEVFWNSSNFLFSKENKEILYVQLLDKIEFVCPTNRTELGSISEDVEQLIIYRVDEIGYKTCTVDQPSKSLIGICSNPNRNSRIPVVFRDFTPQPNLMEYRPGKSYYFISTSNGTRNGLYNLNGGLCAEKNMRLKVHVRKRNSFSNYYAYRSKPYKDENGVVVTDRPESETNDDVRWVGIDGRGVRGPWWSVNGAYAYVKLPSDNENKRYESSSASRIFSSNLFIQSLVIVYCIICVYVL